MRQWIGIAALVLAACDVGSGGGGGGGEDNSGGNGAVADNSADGGGGGGAAGGAAAGGGSPAAMQPGEWEITTQVTGVDAPGVSGATPQGAIAPRTQRACLTQSDLAQPGGIATGGVSNASGCRAEGNSENGSIRSTLRCEGPGGAKVEVTTTGSSTATSLDLSVETRVNAQGTAMSTRARITGRRLGDCPG